MTVAGHHSLVGYRQTRKPRTKMSDQREAAVLMDNDELMAGIAGTGNVRQILRQVSGFVLS
jgi:hypothetical protein